MGEHMRPVFRFALELAEKHDAKIIMLHALEPLNSGTLMAIDIYMPKMDKQEVLQGGMNLEKSVES